MDLSTKHSDARIEAARVPALTASLALLTADPNPAQIEIYGTARPTPGDPPGGAPLVIIQMISPAGVVDDQDIEIDLVVPIEGQVTGADPDDGTVAVWARVVDGAGDWWADLSVSDEAGAGEIKLMQTLLFNGAWARIISAVVGG
jgi:hypothetical protein